MNKLELLCSLLLCGSASAAGTLANAWWGLDMAKATDLEIEGAVTLGVTLDGRERLDAPLDAFLKDTATLVPVPNPAFTNDPSKKDQP